MLDNVDVLVPYAGTCAYRHRALDYVADRYRTLGGRVLVGLGRPGDDWRKADAVDDAYARATRPVLVVADADVWSDGTVVAVAAVANGVAAWATPHVRVHRLNDRSTVRALSGLAPLALTTSRTEMNHPGVAGGGIVVLRRDLYADVPLDRRFRGWGREDHSWGYALETICGPPARYDYPLWHLWHPPARRPGGGAVRSPANEALYRRYHKALFDAPAMMVLIEEAKQDAPAARDRRAARGTDTADPLV